MHELVRQVIGPEMWTQVGQFEKYEQRGPINVDVALGLTEGRCKLQPTSAAVYVVSE